MENVLKKLQAAKKAIEEAEKELRSLAAESGDADEDGVSTVVVVEDENGDEVEVDLAGLSVKELKKFARDYGVEVTASDKNGLIQEIIDVLYAESEPGEEGDEDAEAEEDAEADADAEDESEEDDEAEASARVIYWHDGTETDLEELSLKELKKLAREHDIELSAKDEDGIRDEIYAAFYPDEEAEDEAVEEEEDADEEDIEDKEAYYGLSEMSVEELADLLAEYGLSVKGKREALVDRVIRAIEDGTIPVEDDEGEQ